MAEKTSSPIATFANASKLWVCEHSPKFARSRGVFFGDNPLEYTLPVLVLQTCLVTLLITFLQFLMTPLGESSFVPQILAGLIMGPSMLGQFETFMNLVVPPKTFYISETIALFGSMLFMFLIGVQIDVTSVMRTGKKTWAVGLCSFVVPMILCITAALVIRKMISPEKGLHKSIIYIAIFLSTGSFHVTASHLADLKLLNSELGRLGVSSSLVSGVISSVWVTSILSEKQSSVKEDSSFHWMLLSLLTMLAVIVYVLRPIMLWMIRQTPKGKPIKESYIIWIFIMLLGCAFFGELIGEHYMVGPILLGIAVPDGPPLGSALVDKLHTMVSSIFLPLYYLFSGAKFKLSLIDAHSFVIVQLLALFSFFGKVIGTMLPSLYFKMPVTDALSLGFLMSAQGITQLLYLQTAVYLTIIDAQSYSNVVIAMIWLTGLVTPLVKFLYDPSKRYLSINRRRSIEHADPNAELRLMACIHDTENTPSIINIIEMSNPTYQNPICFYVLHLIRLTGRATPLLIDHEPGKTHSVHSSQSHHIINAFKSYEKHKIGKLVVKLFTSISPYETMHDEICTQAAEKRVSLLIVPFHRLWGPIGVTESAQPIRALNRHLLRTAPCSVGILIERGTLNRNNPLQCASFYSVGVVFIEGQDDREALAYAMRMADHENVRITVIRLMEPRRHKNRTLMTRDHDGDFIHRFKVDYIQIKRHDYREEIVGDGVEMVNFVKSLEGCFDLILVGRRHGIAGDTSSLFCGLTEWNEYPELGFLGDMLVSSDSTFDGSVLVVQQQKRLGVIGHHDLHLDPPIRGNKEEPFTVVEMPHDTKRVYPIT